MTNSEITPEEKQQLLAMPENIIQYPIMPVAIYIQEANDLYVFSLNDLPRLLQAGLSPGIHESLPVRTDLCIKTQRSWTTKYRQAEKPEAELNEGRQLLNELFHHYRFAFRNQPELLRKINNLDRKKSNAALFQNLSTLTIIGEQHADILKPIGFDSSLLSRAKYLSGYLPGRYAQFSNVRLGSRQSRLLRDRAFTWLKQAVDEVRACGKYVFADDQEKYRGYCSSFMQQKARKQKKKRQNRESDETPGK